MPRHLISDAHEWINEIPTVPIIHRIQETQVAIYHILWDLVHTLLADERGNLGGKTA